MLGAFCGAGWAANAQAATYLYRSPVYGLANAPVASAPATDPDWSDVVLLLQMEGTPGSGVFTDSSSLANNGSSANTASAYLTAQTHKFGTGAGAFTGAVDSYVAFSAAPYQFGTNTDFTIEGWVYPTWASGCSGLKTFMSQWASADAGQWFFGADCSTDEVVLTVSAYSIYSDWLVGTVPLTPNAWNAVAFERQGSTYVLFVNGQPAVEGTASGYAVGDAADPNLYMGNYKYAVSVNNAATAFEGYMDEFRITKGVARYPLTGYTPASTAFPTQ